MASLLERLNVDGAGPVRNRGGRVPSSPYVRPYNFLLPPSRSK